MSALGSPSLARHRDFAALKASFEATAATARRIAVERVIPSDIPALDRALGGGFPRGTLTVLEGDGGRWSIAAALVAGVSRRAVAAIIDDGGLYPPSLARAGARLDRVLIVPAQTPLAIARAADVLVRSRACRLILMPAPELRAALWTRLAGLAHRSGVALIAIAPLGRNVSASPLSGAAGVRLSCTRKRLLVDGTQGIWCRFAGYELHAEVRKNTFTASGGRAHVRAASGQELCARAAVR